MTSVVLTYRGAPGERDAAEARLRECIPGVVLTPKTGALVEAQLDEAQLPQLQAQADWQVDLHVYAEVGRPVVNLKNARARLKR